VFRELELWQPIFALAALICMLLNDALDRFEAMGLVEIQNDYENEQVLFRRNYKKAINEASERKRLKNVSNLGSDQNYFP